MIVSFRDREVTTLVAVLGAGNEASNKPEYFTWKQKRRMKYSIGSGGQSTDGSMCCYQGCLQCSGNAGLSFVCSVQAFIFGLLALLLFLLILGSFCTVESLLSFSRLHEAHQICFLQVCSIIFR